MRQIKLFWDRLNCVIGWPLLFIVDIGIAWSGVQTWKQARRFSNGALLKVWNRYRLGGQEGGAVHLPLER